MVTYLFLDTQDKKKLVQLAESKQLSVSTTAGIIIRKLHCFVTEEYIHKGEHQTCIKIKPLYKEWKITSSKATNCIYKYFNDKDFKKVMQKTMSQIQSELDKTIDPNRYKNMEIRIQWRMNKGKTN